MKFGLREVCNVVLKARKDGTFLGKEFKKGQPVLWFDSLKTSGLEGSGEIIYARGGRGNTKLVSWTGDREVTFTMEDALISPMSMALLTAGSLSRAGDLDDDSQAKTIISHRTALVNFSGHASNAPYAITFEDAPNISGIVSATWNGISKKLEIVTLNEDEDVSDVSGTNCIFKGFHSGICLNPEDFGLSIQEESGSRYYAAMENVQIDYYVEKTSDMIQIDISPDSFGAGFYLEGETLFREYGEGGYDQAAEFIVPNCKVQSNFNFSMASTGDPSTFTFTMDAFPAYLDLNSTAGDKVLCAIQVFEEDKK
jgi:hypothetical protein